MRSGTTVIHRALCAARNSNPYISESWFLSDLFNLYTWNMTRFDVRHKDQFGDPSKLTEVIYLNLQYYLDMISAKYENPELLILKHPELTPHFLEMKKLLPQAKFLVIVRDPRDVIASIMDVNIKHQADNIKSPHSHFKTMREYCGFYAGYYQLVLGQRQAFGKDLMFVRYEDIVTEPAKSFERIGKFSGAIYEGDEMKRFDPAQSESLNLEREVRLKDKFSGAFWSDLYTKDLSPTSIGKHKKSLSATETQEIEKILGQIGRMFEYWK